MNLCSWSWLVCVVFAVAFVQCCSAKVSAQADVCFTFGGGQHVSLNVCTVGLLLFRLFVGNQANMRKSIWIASARIVARRRYRQLRNRAPCGVWLRIQSSLLLSADDQTTVKKISRTLVQTKLQQHVRHCSQDMMDNSMVDHLRLLLACYVFARPKLSLLSLTIDIACATSLVTGVHFQSQFCCMFFSFVAYLCGLSTAFSSCHFVFLAAALLCVLCPLFGKRPRENTVHFPEIALVEYAKDASKARLQWSAGGSEVKAHREHLRQLGFDKDRIQLFTEFMASDVCEKKKTSIQQQIEDASSWLEKIHYFAQCFRSAEILSSNWNRSAQT